MTTTKRQRVASASAISRRLGAAGIKKASARWSSGYRVEHAYDGSVEVHYSERGTIRGWSEQHRERIVRVNDRIVALLTEAGYEVERIDDFTSRIR